MFQQAFFYSCQMASELTPEDIEEGLRSRLFPERKENDHNDYEGFIPPHEGFQTLVHSVQGRTLFRLLLEEKKIPTSEINLNLAQRIKRIESTELREVGRLEKSALKADVISQLRPRAFFERKVTLGFFDHKRQLLVIGSNAAYAAKVATRIRNLFREKYQYFRLCPIVHKQNTHGVQTTIKEWLMGGMIPPKHLDFGSFIQIEGQEGEIFKLSHSFIEPEEMEERLMPKSKVEFVEMVLKEEGEEADETEETRFKFDRRFHVSRIRYPSSVVYGDTIQMPEGATEAEKSAITFDTNFVLISDALTKIFDTLFYSLGGNVEDDGEVDFSYWDAKSRSELSLIEVAE